MTKAETLQLLDTLSGFYFCIEELGYTKQEAIEALGLDFDPDNLDLVFQRNCASGR